MRGLEYLHPKMRSKAVELQKLCAAKGVNLLITDTFRTVAEQNALYAQGRTSPGNIVTNAKGDSYQSPHMWGVAFDFCRNEKGREYIDSDGFFKTVGTLAKSIGLCWGGDFKRFVDKPHLELDEYLPSHSTSTLKSKYGTPDNFKKTWGMDAGSTSSALSASTASYDTPTLKKGDKDDAVKAMQTKLAASGYSLAIDGSFGSLTENAIKLFQKAKGLSVDGICGPKTWAALNENNPSDASLMPIIRLGSMGEAVRLLQQKLDGLTVDGVFGSLTENRVRSYQAASGLASDGVCGPKTWAKLLGV